MISSASISEEARPPLMGVSGRVKVVWAAVSGALSSTVEARVGASCVSRG